MPESYEVPQPILNSPFDEPAEYWHMVEGEAPERGPGRRAAVYYYRDPRANPTAEETGTGGTPVELELVNLIRERAKAWRAEGYPGVTRPPLELLHWWRREGRDERKRLFFAQLEAAETILFLAEARPDFRQGLAIPRDEPSDEKRAEGYKGFLRYACKMATGTGKTTVMGMLAAWSILNKVKNWHVFEPQGVQMEGLSGRVLKAGVPVRTRETITIGAKTTTARGTRYLTSEDFERQVAAGMLTVLAEDRDREGNLKKVAVESVRYVESDTALVNRLLGREVGGKQNILVLNDEAHHADRKGHLLSFRTDG